MASETGTCPDCARLTAYLTGRLSAIYELLRVDHQIGADPYDDVARLREVEGALRILNHRGEGTIKAKTRGVRSAGPPGAPMGVKGTRRRVREVVEADR